MAIPQIEIKKINASTFQLHKISSTLIKKLMDKFAYLPPGYKFNPRFRLMGINGVKVRMVNVDGSFPSGLLSKITKFLDDNNKKYIISDEIHEHNLSLLDFFEDDISDMVFSDYEFSDGVPVQLRDYQLEAIKTTFEKRNGLLNLSTGAGKCLAGKTTMRVRLPKDIVDKYNLKIVK